MKKEDSEILKKLGKESGFKVPQDYFANFTTNLLDSLPEVKIQEEVKPTIWMKVRPFVYMAAMFAGIWVMMNIFTLGKKSSATMQQRKAQISSGLAVDKNADDFIDYGFVNDYEYMMDYEDSLFMDEEMP